MGCLDFCVLIDGGIRQNVFVETEDNCMSCDLRISE